MIMVRILLKNVDTIVDQMGDPEGESSKNQQEILETKNT